MPSQVLSSVENNFTKGLITESTGLNFPENAATDADNCTFTLVGNTMRREGIDFEANRGLVGIDKTNAAINTYKWNNAGGLGEVQLIAGQVGTTVFFWNSSSATTAAPMSTLSSSSSINLALFISPALSVVDSTAECTFSDGNGYLFIFHPSCDPIYCTYTPGGVNGVIVGNRIDMKVRDFTGISFGEGPTNVRPLNLTPEHQYNLMNQGWSSGPTWVGTYAAPWTIAIGTFAFTVPAGLVGVAASQLVSIQSTSSSFGIIPPGTIVASATVVSYVGTVLTLAVGGIGAYAGATTNAGNIFNVEVGYINTFKSAVGVEPSNADVWWYFKDNTNTFNPATTVNQVTLGQGNAPQGHFIFNPFYQDRSAQTGITGLTDIVTTKRPTNGTWFQGRVWYTGVNTSQAATGDAPFYTWTENIYFSQIVNQVSDFGKCYQENDPTSETLFDLLATDGGVITIQGSGPIYKLFPIQNGMLVFASNGVWFITGSQGIGFSANDYTINKISNVRSISSTSFVNVLGLPYFWNDDGIYAVEQEKNGGMSVNAITVGTILTFYNAIPQSSRRYARGDYHSIDYVIQWIYQDIEATNVNTRYSFNRMLNYNVYNKAFYPYSIDVDTNNINSINYVSGPGGVSTSEPSFKYLTSFADVSIAQFSFADEHVTTYLDWASTSRPSDFTSYFVTGYKLHGQGQRRFQVGYIYTFSKNDIPTSFYIQGIWDYALTGNSGRYSLAQLVNNWSPNFGVVFRRHKIRGRGLVLQIKISSVSGQAFDIIGWSTFEQMNTGV